MKIKKIWLSGVAAGIALFGLFGCGPFGNSTQDAPSGNGTLLSVKEDGSVTSSITDSFDETYYLQSELQTMIESEIAAFNAENGADSITFEEVRAEDGKVLVVLHYANADAYAGYTGAVLFVGTIGEAKEKGFDLNITCHEPDDAEAVMAGREIEAMDDSHVVITNEPYIPALAADREEAEADAAYMLVETFDVVRYVSDGVVQGSGRNQVGIESKPDRSDGLSYIIFD